MTDLQKLVAGIVNDLITARFEADAVAAEYSRMYKDDPLMRAMKVPALNISNVSVDLRLAFATPEPVPAATPGGVSVIEQEAIGEIALALRDRVLSTRTMEASELDNRKLAGAKNALRIGIERKLTETSSATPIERKAIVTEEINRLLAEREIKLDDKELRAIGKDIDGASSRLTTAKVVAEAGKDVRNVITGTEELAKISPEAISSIKFDVNLDGMRWVDIESSQAEGGKSVLSEQ